VTGLIARRDACRTVGVRRRRRLRRDGRSRLQRVLVIQLPL